MENQNKDNFLNGYQKLNHKYRPQPVTNHPQCRNPFPQENRGISRLIYSTGKCNVSKNRTPEFWMAHIKDFSHTLVESSWKWILIAFISSYILCWLIFAWFYKLVALSNGDHDGNYTSPQPCFEGIESFVGYYLFSLETQHSIGFGTRYITDNCVEGVFIMSMQVIIGSAICGGMATLVYTKMVKPKNGNVKKLFAKNAVICQRNGRLCLLFRVRDLENRHQIGTKITAFVIERRKQSPFLKSLKLETPGLLLWPIELCHLITPSSPLWNISANDFLKMRLEFILTMEGSSASTGQTSTTKTSYISSEILWGHRFRSCIKYDKDENAYIVNQEYFHETEEVLTPLCSGSHLQKLFESFCASPQNMSVTRPASAASSVDNSSSTPSSGFIQMSDEKEKHTEKNKNFLKEVVRKLSVISESLSKEAVENPNTPAKTNVTKDEIAKLEEDLDKCLKDLNQDLWEIIHPEKKRDYHDVEKLIANDLENNYYNQTHNIYSIYK